MSQPYRASLVIEPASLLNYFWPTLFKASLDIYAGSSRYKNSLLTCQDQTCSESSGTVLGS